MFEFGKLYTLTFVIPDGKSQKLVVERDIEVASEAMPIIKFTYGGHEVITNVSSPSFVKGELQP